MAQGLLAHHLPQVTVMSAGCGALAGKAADPLAVEMMSERGIDIRRHVAADLTIEHARQAQLILVMTQNQKKEIEQRYPFSKGRVFLYAGSDGEDVIDPYRKGREVFEASLAQIERGAVHWVGAINRLRK